MTKDVQANIVPVEDYKLPPIGHAISGAVGSTIANLFIYPLDISTTRLQLSNDKDNRKGILQTISEIYQKEGGLTALYAGLGSDTVATVLSSFIYFYCYTALRNLQEKLNRSMGKADISLNIAQELFLGAEAALISRLFTTPVSNITTHLQSNNNASDGAKGQQQQQKKGFRQIAARLFKQRGIKGFWTGYCASIILVTNPSITYFVFEKLKRIYTKNNHHTLSSFHVFLLSALSKSMATMITYPFILLRTTMINGQHEQRQSAHSGNDNRGIMATLRKVVKEEGFLGLYRGMQSQILKGFFNQGIMYMIKDYLATYLTLIFYYKTYKGIKSSN